MEVLDTVEAALKVNVQNIVYEAACALGDDAVCFIPTFGNWGRTNPIEKGEYEWEMWAGAAHCDTEKNGPKGLGCAFLPKDRE